MKPKSLIGGKFGRLTAIALFRVRVGGTSRRFWKCKCDCGKKKSVLSTRLMLGKVKSCGCLVADTLKNNTFRKVHGEASTGKASRLYRIWSGLKQRCVNPNAPAFKWYGARGIGVCKIWKNSFLKFKEWSIANGYSDKLQIDRINNDGDYSPINCRWTTSLVNNNNRRKRHVRN